MFVLPSDAPDRPRPRFMAEVLIILAGAGALAGCASPGKAAVSPVNERAWVSTVNHACVGAINSYYDGGAVVASQRGVLAASSIANAAAAARGQTPPTGGAQRMASQLTVLAEAQNALVTAVQQGTIREGVEALMRAETANHAVASTARQMGAPGCVQMTAEM